MIAVVMAGGLGTRLHPLTCSQPKPMVPIFDKPLLHYVMEKLKALGFWQVRLTLHYLPETIINYFGDGSNLGMKFTYSLECKPLGTAGSVRQAAAGVEKTILVLSGDVLFSFDLAAAFRFHRQRGALITVLLQQRDDPQGFGIAAMDETGRMLRYHEKPAPPQEIFSNLINTGTYFIEPEALALIPSNSIFDFSKNLFPLLLERNLPFYGYTVQGEWNDLGTLHIYRKVHQEMFQGTGCVTIPGRQETESRIWMADGVNIAPRAILRPPVFLGEGVCLEDGVIAGPGAVIGAGTILNKNSRVMQSILGKGNRVGEGTVLEDVIFAGNNITGKHCRLQGNVVLGEGSGMAAYCTLINDVKVWPHHHFPPNTMLEQVTIDR